MILKKIKEIIQKDRFVTDYREHEVLRSRQIVALIAGIGFLIMSIANIREQSKIMLISTLVGSAAMLLSFVLSRVFKSNKPLYVSFTLVLAGLLPLYVLRGGNNGFAALWLCVVTYLSMYFVDFLYGFLLNIYYAIFLLIVFNVEIPYVNYDAYGETFMLRFPMLFVINFAFATFFIVSSRNTQYELIQSQEQFKNLSITDLNTGTFNRNAFISYLNSFDNSKDILTTIVYIDANGLHEINNNQGHEAGDIFLKSIADECKDLFAEDTVYRMGGDEFLIISHKKDYETADSLMKKVCYNLSKQKYTISYGIESKSTELNLDVMVNEANRIMLENKANFYKTSGNDRRSRS